MDSIFHRTSIRSFEKKDIEPAMIQKLLKAAMAAPSAGNQQPWEFYVVTNPDLKGKLAACSPYAGCAATAPMIIVPCCRKQAMFPENVIMDLSAATQNILLEADALGLGSVWLGIAPLEDRMDAVTQVLSLPEELIPFCLLPIGYPQAIRPQQDRYDESRIHYVI